MNSADYVSLKLPYHIAAPAAGTTPSGGFSTITAAATATAAAVSADALSAASLDSRFALFGVRPWPSGFLPARASVLPSAVGGSATGLVYLTEGNTIRIWDLASDATLNIELGPTAVTALSFTLEECATNVSGQDVAFVRHVLYATTADRLVRCEFSDLAREGPTDSSAAGLAAPTPSLHSKPAARPLFHSVMSPTPRAGGAAARGPLSSNSSNTSDAFSHSVVGPRFLTLHRFDFAVTANYAASPVIALLASAHTGVKHLVCQDGSVLCGEWVMSHAAAGSSSSSSASLSAPSVSHSLRVTGPISPIQTIWTATKAVWSWMRATRPKAIDAITFPSGIVILFEDRSIGLWCFLAHGAVRHDPTPLPGQLKGDFVAMQHEGDDVVVIATASGQRCFLKVSASEQRALAVTVLGVKDPPTCFGPLSSGTSALTGGADASRSAFVWNQSSANQTFLMTPRRLVFEPTAAGQLRELVVALPPRAPGDVFLSAWVAHADNLSAAPLSHPSAPRSSLSSSGATTTTEEVSVLIASRLSGVTRIHVAGASSTLLRGLLLSPNSAFNRAVASLGQQLVAQLLLRTVLDSKVSNASDVSPFWDRLCVPSLSAGPPHPSLGPTMVVQLSPATIVYRQHVEAFLEDDSWADAQGVKDTLAHCRLVRDAGRRLFADRLWADASNAPYITDAACITNSLETTVVLASSLRDLAHDAVNVQAKLLHGLLVNLSELSELLQLFAIAPTLLSITPSGSTPGAGNVGRGIRSPPSLTSGSHHDSRLPLRQWLYDGQSRLDTAVSWARYLMSHDATTFAGLHDALRDTSKEPLSLSLISSTLRIEVDVWEQYWMERCQQQQDELSRGGARGGGGGVAGLDDVAATLYGCAPATEIAIGHALTLVLQGLPEVLSVPLGDRGMALLWACALNACRDTRQFEHQSLCEGHLINVFDCLASEATSGDISHTDVADIVQQVLTRLPPTSLAVRTILTQFLTIRGEPYEGDFTYAEVFAALPREAVSSFLVSGSPFNACWRARHETATPEQVAKVCDAFLDVAERQPASLVLRRKCIERAALVASKMASHSAANADATSLAPDHHHRHQSTVDRLASCQRRLNVQQHLIQVIQHRIEATLNEAAAMANGAENDEVPVADDDVSALESDVQDTVRRLTQQLNQLLQVCLLTIPEAFSVAQGHIHFGGELIVLDILAAEEQGAAVEEGAWVEALEAAIFKRGPLTPTDEAVANAEDVVKRLRSAFEAKRSTRNASAPPTSVAVATAGTAATQPTIHPLPLPYIISAFEVSCAPPDSAVSRLRKLGVSPEELARGYQAVMEGHAAIHPEYQPSMVTLLSTLADLCRQLPPGSDAAQQCLAKVDTRTRKLQSDVQRGTVSATREEIRSLESIRQRLADFEASVASSKVALKQRSLFF